MKIVEKSLLIPKIKKKSLFLFPLDVEKLEATQVVNEVEESLLDVKKERELKYCLDLLRSM